MVHPDDDVERLPFPIVIRQLKRLVIAAPDNQGANWMGDEEFRYQEDGKGPKTTIFRT